jgi:hypothetical protein
VAFDFDPGALLGRFYPLDDGFRIGLRVARSSDAGPIRELFGRQPDRDTSELEVARLTNFDPRQHCVLTATALIDGVERLVGVGSIGLRDDPPPDLQPELVIVDPEVPEAVRGLLAGALAGRAEALARDRAA